MTNQSTAFACSVQELASETIPVATPEICCYCFDVLIAHLSGKPAPSPFETTVNCPLFVTFERNGKLRGCIGNLCPQSLRTAVAAYTLHSALRDRRFQPVTLEEVADLTVAVSFLVHYETCQSWDDWVLGKHGLIIKFSTLDGTTKSATFLPEVAAQQGWNHRQTVTALIRKAGVLKEDAVDFDELLCTRFESSKATCSYAQYASEKGIAHRSKLSTEDTFSGCSIA